jgi:hypothetical protein
MVLARALLDPRRRGRQIARLVQLAGTRAGGFVLTRQLGAEFPRSLSEKYV